MTCAWRKSATPSASRARFRRRLPSYETGESGVRIPSGALLNCLVTHVLEKMGEKIRLIGHDDVVLMDADSGRMPSASALQPTGAISSMSGLLLEATPRAR